MEWNQRHYSKSDKIEKQFKTKKSNKGKCLSVKGNSFQWSARTKRIEWLGRQISNIWNRSKPTVCL